MQIDDSEEEYIITILIEFSNIREITQERPEENPPSIVYNTKSNKANYPHLDKKALKILNEWCDDAVEDLNRSWYPTESEKETMAEQTDLSLIQLNNWFSNRRRRDKRFLNYPHLQGKRRRSKRRKL